MRRANRSTDLRSRNVPAATCSNSMSPTARQPRWRKSPAVVNRTTSHSDSISHGNFSDHTLEDCHMKSRLYLSTLALGITLAAVGCGKDNPTTPTPVDPQFTATLLAANETSAV